jgi:hypothetical protein
MVEISAHRTVSQGDFVMTTADVEARHDVTVAVREKGVRFQIERASIDPPRPDDVIVRVVATGVCLTDMLVRDQDYPAPLPAVLGHEGSGIVEAVGSAVAVHRKPTLSLLRAVYVYAPVQLSRFARFH